MTRFLTLFSFLLFVIISSCTSKQPIADLDQIKANVRDYFFLADSIEINVEVIDTLGNDDLAEMMDQVNKNLNLIDRDLDTLSLMIDGQAYAAMYVGEELDKKLLLNRSSLEDSLQHTSIRKLEYQLKQAQLIAKKQVFKQTSRLLLHLKRSVKNGVAGYNIAVHYAVDNELLDLELLLDANFNVVD